MITTMCKLTLLLVLIGSGVVAWTSRPINLNSCASVACVNGGRCHDGAYCICLSGFTGSHCQINIDECISNPCLNGGTCSNGNNAFKCKCPEDYTGPTCSAKANKGIYLFGGVTKNFTGLTNKNDAYATTVLKFNPDTNAITSSNFPFTGFMNVGIMKNNNMVLFSSWYGPWKGYGLYSIINNSVVILDNIPKIVCGAPFPYPSATVAGDIYVNCGWNGTANEAVCVLYNTKTHWNKVVKVNEQKNEGCMVALNATSVIWMAGSTNSVLLIDVKTGRLQNVATLLESRRYPACALYGPNTIVMCGGRYPRTASCVTLSLSTFGWGSFPSMTTNRGVYYALVPWGSRLYAMGGSGLSNSIEYSDGKSWTTSAVSLPAPRWYFGTAVIHG